MIHIYATGTVISATIIKMIIPILEKLGFVYLQNSGEIFQKHGNKEEEFIVFQRRLKSNSRNMLLQRKTQGCYEVLYKCLNNFIKY